VDKLLESAFWVDGWKTFSSAPEIAIPLIPLLILVGVVVWWIRGVVNGREISGLKEQLGSLKEQIGTVKEQAGVLNQRRLLANEQLTVVKKNDETLRAEVAALRKKIPKGARHNELATSVDTVTNTITKLTAANDQLDRTLKRSGLVPLNPMEKDALNAALKEITLP
jgi:molecular chaperone GrpE (heat shock protein)